MSLINRPFRGFSGVYTAPLPPLPLPSSTTTSLDSQRSTTSSAASLALSSEDAAPKPRRSLFHRSKSSSSHLFFSQGQSHHHHHHHHHHHQRSPPPRQDENRPQPPCRAHTAQLPEAPAPPKGRLAGLLRRHRSGGGEKAPSSEEVQRELEELYVAVYSKAERRAFFREWKARQEERDRWECEEFERGVVYEEGEVGR